VVLRQRLDIELNTLYLKTKPLYCREVAISTRYSPRNPSHPSPNFVHPTNSLSSVWSTSPHRLKNTLTGRQCDAVVLAYLLEIQKHCKIKHGWQRRVKRGRVSGVVTMHESSETRTFGPLLDERRIKVSSCIWHHQRKKRLVWPDLFG
jgi:hypothetical protein